MPSKVIEQEAGNRYLSTLATLRVTPHHAFLGRCDRLGHEHSPAEKVNPMTRSAAISPTCRCVRKRRSAWRTLGKQICSSGFFASRPSLTAYAKIIDMTRWILRADVGAASMLAIQRCRPAWETSDRGPFSHRALRCVLMTLS
jgi:hypothetical protein